MKGENKKLAYVSLIFSSLQLICSLNVITDLYLYVYVYVDVYLTLTLAVYVNDYVDVISSMS